MWSHFVIYFAFLSAACKLYSLFAFYGRSEVDSNPRPFEQGLSIKLSNHSAILDKNTIYDRKGG